MMDDAQNFKQKQTKKHKNFKKTNFFKFYFLKRKFN
jgi:hypothetical protein